MSGREQHPAEDREEYSRVPPERLAGPVFDGTVILTPVGEEIKIVISEPDDWEDPIVQRPLIDDQGRIRDYGPEV